MATFDDPVERIAALIDKVEPKFRRRFLTLIEEIRDERSITEIANLLAAGRFDLALVNAELAAVNLTGVFTGTFILAGNEAADFLSDALQAIVSFDVTNERAVTAMRRNQLRLVTRFTHEQRLATRVALIDGVRRGLNPRQQALLFRQSIGLSATQMRAVLNYRRLLESSSSGALDRVLRDHRFDRTVQRAISAGRPLPAAQIDTMVDRYAQRQLAHRAETIALSEALAAVHEGTDELYRQAVALGHLDPTEMAQLWHPRADGKTRRHHASMRGQVRLIGEPFISGLGNRLRFPGDPRAPANDRIRCRCIKTTRFTVDLPADIQEELFV